MPCWRCWSRAWWSATATCAAPWNALAAFGRVRAELERLRADGLASPGPATNPTLPSIPINGDRAGAGPVAGPEAEVPAGEEADDSFLPGAFDVPADEQVPFEPRHSAWSLGAPTSDGMRFRILRPYAQGGIGKVSVAFDAELQREVALKQIKKERADDADSRARFLLEAEVTGRLEHPGIVPVYGLGMDDDGQPFYAMRFVRGTSYEEAIRRFHAADEDPAATRVSGRCRCGTCSTGSSTSARPWPTPTAGACSIAT